MGGDLVSSSRIETNYLQNAIELAIEHRCAPKEAIDRLGKLLAACRYVEAEEERWHYFVQRMEDCQHAYAWDNPERPKDPENSWNDMLRQAAEAVLAGPPPPQVTPELERAGVKTILALLVDKYGGGDVSVLLDAALEERRP